MWGPCPTTESKGNGVQHIKSPPLSPLLSSQQTLYRHVEEPRGAPPWGRSIGCHDTKHAVAANGGERHHERDSQGRPLSFGRRSFGTFLPPGAEKWKGSCRGVRDGENFLEKSFPRTPFKNFQQKGIGRVIGHPIAKGERLTRRGMSTGQNFGSSADHVGPLPHNCIKGEYGGENFLEKVFPRPLSKTFSAEII